MATLDLTFEPARLRPAPPLGENEVHVWRVDLAAPLAPPENVLSREETQRAARMSHARTQRNFRHARTALRLILGAYAQAEPAVLPIAAGQHGKPACALEGAPRFNVSHSGEWALIALARADVGVDLEAVRPVTRLARLAENYFTPAEAEILAALPADARTDAFHACWTRKEAFVKTGGGGLTLSLRSFEVEFRPDRAAGLVSVGGRATSGHTLHGFRPAPGFQGAVCVAAPNVMARGFAPDASSIRHTA